MAPQLPPLLIGGLILLATLGSATAEAGPSPQDSLPFYRSRYGTVARGSEPAVEKAFVVFEQLRAIAGSLPTARLEVSASSGSPWSLALPDGSVVLSLGAIHRCYQGVGQGEGEARIAFIIGHELAHLANNDFWHQESFFRLVGKAEPALLTSATAASDLLATTPRAADSEERGCRALAATEEERHCLEALQVKRQTALTARRGKELAADDRGFLYAAMAGYQVETLLAPSAGEEDFLTFWVRQTGADEGLTHPAAKERTALLRNRLLELANMVELFKFGVRQAAFGRYDEAIAFFDQFRRLFPSREVLTNLGYCYLAKALGAMPRDRASRYWLPLELGLATRLDSLTARGGPLEGPGADLTPAVRVDLQQAVALFKAACARDEGYLPARINLAAACFLQGEMFEARAAVEHAERLAPDNPELLGLKALIQSREGQAAEAEAIRRVRELVHHPASPPALRFNLARLLEEHKEAPAAMVLWRELAGQGRELPPLYRAQVVKAVGGGEQEPVLAATPALPWPLPEGVTLGRDIVAPAVAASLFPRPRWQESGFTSAGQPDRAAAAQAMGGRIFTQQGGDMVLAMDDFVEMVVLKGGRLGTAQALRARCGPPVQRRTLAEGDLWSYGPAWMALVKEETIKEVWVARLQ